MLPLRATDPSAASPRRRRRAVAALAVAGLLLGVPTSAVASAPLPPVRYAALGDSYSAGVGTGRDDVAGPPCERSSLGYPQLWAATHPGTALTFLACSGARIAGVRKQQVPAVPRDATLVTVTMGGNDVGFSPVIAVCSTVPGEHACSVAVKVATAIAVTEVPLELTLTLLAVHRRAPHARVVVLGYPRLFELGACTGRVPDAGRRALIDRGTDRLDDVLGRTATALGARFVDVRGAFAGHGVCAAPGQAWINGPDGGPGAYHPTATGYAAGYLPLLSAVTG